MGPTGNGLSGKLHMLIYGVSPIDAFLVELRLYTPISHPVHLKLKHQSCALNSHVQREIQIIKFHTLRCRKSGEQALWYRIQVSRERANIHQPLSERTWRSLGVARNEVVLNYEGLAGPEVARVVEGYWR